MRWLLVRKALGLAWSRSGKRPAQRREPALLGSPDRAAPAAVAPGALEVEPSHRGCAVRCRAGAAPPLRPRATAAPLPVRAKGPGEERGAGGSAPVAARRCRPRPSTETTPVRGNGREAPPVGERGDETKSVGKPSP